MDRFLYLVQSAGRLPESYASIASAQSDLLQLTWKEPLEGAIYYPKSTWTQGRNRLLAEAMRRPQQYLYYIFLDDDVLFEKGSWRSFEEALLKYQPAIASPYFPEYPPVNRSRLDLEAHTCFYFDAMFNAFHRDVVRDGLMLPYYQGWDHESWWYSQLFIMRLAGTLYPRHTVQVNSVIIHNTKHGQYPQGEDWKKVEQWFDSEVLNQRPPGALEKLRQKIEGRLRRLLNRPYIQPAYRPPQPPSRQRSYRVSSARRQRLLNCDSTFWAKSDAIKAPSSSPAASIGQDANASVA